jgi:AraC-like DNA-binding protein
MTGKLAEAHSAVPAPELRRLVDCYTGMRYEGFAPGAHLGLPSRHLTVAVSIGSPLRVAVPDRSSGPQPFVALAAGLHTRPATVTHDGSQHLVSFELTPLGARCLLGAPAAELAGTVVELDDLLGNEARELIDRLTTATDWQACVTVLDDLLCRLARKREVSEGAVEGAWHRLVECGGKLRVGDLARETGYSRRQLAKRFVREYGLTPKQVARVIRFERSWHVLRRVERRRRLSSRPERLSLAELAVRCGYYDQAHLTREWNNMADCPPSAWLASEELPFVQDAAVGNA